MKIKFYRACIFVGDRLFSFGWKHMAKKATDEQLVEMIVGQIKRMGLQAQAVMPKEPPGMTAALHHAKELGGGWTN
jgi:hypothetical protein